ncbi:conjugal transfer mating-pair stabilization protein TraG [Raoultella ornithinolytica]|uniref:conjugal transfer mating-pair stabilization protein TraG n=1 Tax=Raoultella ornithinolytica TaxID=54291 RepID=UPI00255A8331|nr:conjugal transfer mating-pair stabilization protein TraG [Raoultella ornithinolytica]MDL4585337.1 conjugal transfer mating-pair stabilization protein TraG [Raoultella ornithinolytica]MDV1095635.1 conjugal transfer mating-pair stabilization protein TraG [Raoultella ornithinolytica]MDV1123186.1 conjugal transfer mating-pair stabilization protein TraG [Raoultella ornithinolytica]MDV1893546.1 conjugal transfer mating-pair stabilization protein TraG [Raoultella ornithinolytica]HEC2564901.1 conju
MDTVYVLTGGEFLSNIFNGVATMLGTTAWSSMFRIAALIAVMVLFATYIRGHDPLEIIKFLAFFILLTSILVIPKRTVQIIDRSNATSIHTVANVPLGLAAPAKFITSIGTALTEGFETVYHTPDSVTYSKTGMLFGANLVGTATDFIFRNGDLAELFTAYVRNCVVGDILLNNKYSFQELMNSTDPYSLIFRNPSPLRGVMVSYGNTAATREGFWTCQELANNVLKSQLNVDTSTGGKTWDYYVSRITGAKANASALFGTLMADSYNYYYGGGASASQVMRSAVVMNGLKQGISSYSAQNGDAAGLVNLATQSSYAKMRLSQATSASIATTYLPLMNTVLLAMVIGLFPVIILLATVHSLTLQVLKGYIYTLIYLQAWGPMFAILNYAVSSYLTNKTSSLSFSLSNLSVIQQTHADIGSIAGWLSLSIPFLAMGLVKGLGSVVSQAGNYLGTAMNSTASSESSRAGDGSWAFNNLQTDNVAGNKWDTNYASRSGMAMTQMGNGATATRTQSGASVYDTSGAISRLPTDIQLDRSAVSGFQRQQREAESQLQSLSNSLSHSASTGTSQLSQWASQRGNSDTVSRGADNSVSANEATAISKMQSAITRHARDNNISEADSLRMAMEQSQNLSANAGVGVYAKFDSNRQFAGKILGFASGMSVGGDLHGKIDYNAQNGSSHGTSTDMSNRTSTTKDFSAQDLKDIRHGVDVVASHRTTDSSSHTDNASGSLLNQMAATFSDMRTQASQYSDTQNRSHEYAQMASFVENNSAAIRSNATQEFVEYAKQNHPDAERVLTDVSSPEARAEREALAGRFVEERMMPQLEAQFRANQGRSAEGMGGTVAAGELQGVSHSDFDDQQQHMAQTAVDRGVKAEGAVASEVSQSRADVQRSVDSAQENVNKQYGEVHKKYTELEREHQVQGHRFDEANKAEHVRQDAIPVWDRAKSNEAKSKLGDMMKDFKENE